LTGGRIGRRLAGFDVLLLTTVGRHSGRPRVVALTWLPHGEAWVVAASYAGSDEQPAWWLNLQAQPDAWIQVGRERHRVRARDARGAERNELWARFIATDAAYGTYEQRTQRVIPVVILERVGT
jgi:deazaflavin-dependent oxidoreductase (nitroreductase family)